LGGVIVGVVANVDKSHTEGVTVAVVDWNMVKVLDRSVVYVGYSGRGEVLGADGVAVHKFIQQLETQVLRLRTRSRVQATGWWAESWAGVGVWAGNRSWAGTGSWWLGSRSELRTR
jgi:hypothetical protein